MSYITKRDRLFNEYQVPPLPPRNEGKLKAFASSTDTRAWSHLGAEQAEHLVELIKRNSQSCAPHVVPTSAIVETLMAGKNAALRRLARRVRLLQEMLLAYEDLELSCDQKCEIARIHAAIKAASRGWNPISSLNSSFNTDVSDAYESGKSGGDSFAGQDNRDLQMNTYTSEKSTNIHDPRIQDMQDTIVSKDAKLSVMQNTIEVMESDSCEPYCVYAHIYTALEKIFGILNQNPTYRQYLDLLSAGKDIRDVDIKAKIMIKIKIFEKFCVALLAPCSEPPKAGSRNTCCCYTQISPSYKCTYACTSIEKSEPIPDSTRNQLIADIMETDDMKEIMYPTELNGDIMHEEPTHDKEKINQENVTRLKNLQANYNDLVTFYENLKHEKHCLVLRCHRYIEMEEELDSLKSQLREYNTLWNEREYYKKRSENLDNLKQEYYILSEEASNIENALKADKEICYMKSRTIEELRSENQLLENKLHDTTLSFEKERNNLLCKLKECDCKIMCHEQQIRSLSGQIDTLLEHDQDQQNNDIPNPATLLDDMEYLKSEMNHLRELLSCSEGEKRNLNEQIEEKINIINDLKNEIEKWKLTYEDTLRRNNELEKNVEQNNEDLSNFINENVNLKAKTSGFENLNELLNSKLLEIGKLNNEIEQRNTENYNLQCKLHELQLLHDDTLNEQNAITEKSSRELLERSKSYEILYQKHKQRGNEIIALKEELDNVYKKLHSCINDNNLLSDDKSKLAKDLEEKESEIKVIKNLVDDLEASTFEEHNALKKDMTELAVSLKLAETNSHELLQKNKSYEDVLQNTQKEYDSLYGNFLSLQEENNLLKSKLRGKDDVIILLHDKQIEKDNLIESLTQDNASISSLSTKLKDELQSTVQGIITEKNKLQEELQNKNSHIENQAKALVVCKNESDSLSKEIEKNKKLIEGFDKLKNESKNLATEKENLIKELNEKNIELDQLQQFLKTTNEDLNDLYNEANKFTQIESDLKQTKLNYDSLLKEYDTLKSTNEELLTKLDISDTMKKENGPSSKNWGQTDNIDPSQSRGVSDVVDPNFTPESNKAITNANQFKQLNDAYNNLLKEYGLMKEEKEQNRLLVTELQSTIMQLSIEIDNMNAESSTNPEVCSIPERNTQGKHCPITEKLSQNNSVRDPLDEISQKVTELQKEKTQCQNKIRVLRDKLDLYDETINTLREDVAKRDDRISGLQNYINELEDEVRNLHKNLEDAIEVGEHFRDSKNDILVEKLKIIDERHSKAKNEIQTELDKINEQNNLLEQRLSTAQIQSDSASNEKKQYVSEIKRLKNERDIVLNEVKDLEITVTGETDLSVSNCDIVSLVEAIDNIRKSYDDRIANSSSLQSTLQQVKSSSHILLSKADEAKRLAEHEKLKIFKEKEEAVRERLLSENRMKDVQKQLEHQISMDEATIKNLEYELMNQKFVMDKYSESTQLHIDKLKDELDNLKNMYSNALTTIKSLKKDLKDDAAVTYVTTQTNKPIENLANSSKTELKDAGNSVEETYSLNLIESRIDPITTIPKSTQNHNTFSESEQIYYSMPNHKREESVLRPMQEIQIFTASVEPTMEVFKKQYMEYKVKHLSTGPVENHTYPSQIFDTPQSNGDLIDKKISSSRVEFDSSNTNDLYKTDVVNTPRDGVFLVQKIEQKLPINHTKKTPAESSLANNNSKYELNSKKVSDIHLTTAPVDRSIDTSPLNPIDTLFIDHPNMKNNISGTTSNETPYHDSQVVKRSENIISNDNDKEASKFQGLDLNIESNNPRSKQKHVEKNNLSSTRLSEKLKGSNLHVIAEIATPKPNNSLSDDDIEGITTSSTSMLQSKKSENLHDNKVFDKQTKYIKPEQILPENKTASKIEINVSQRTKDDSKDESLLPKIDNLQVEGRHENEAKIETVHKTYQSLKADEPKESKNINTNLNSNNSATKMSEHGQITSNQSSNTEKSKLLDRNHLPEIANEAKNKMDEKVLNDAHHAPHITNVLKNFDDNDDKQLDKSSRKFKTDDTIKLFTEGDDHYKKVWPSNSSTTAKDSDKLIYSQEKNVLKTLSSSLDAVNILHVKDPSFKSESLEFNNSVDKTEKTKKKSMVLTPDVNKPVDLEYNDASGTAIFNSSSDQFVNISHKTTDTLEPTKHWSAASLNVKKSVDLDSDYEEVVKTPTSKVSDKITKTSQVVEKSKKPHIDSKYPNAVTTKENEKAGLKNLPLHSDSDKLHTSTRETEKTTDPLVKIAVDEDKISYVSGNQQKNNSLGYLNSAVDTSFEGPKRPHKQHKLSIKLVTDSNSLTEEMVDKNVPVTTDLDQYYKNEIKKLENALIEKEQDCKRKIEAFKQQYDANIKDMIYKHNQGVKCMQSLHEETLRDFIKTHENEVESLRSMSIEAMKKADTVEKEKGILLHTLSQYDSNIDEKINQDSSFPISTQKRPLDTRKLSQTKIEAFNVKPKSLGPCSCYIDSTISETIKNIFDNVDVEQRRSAEQTYLKYIAKKLLSENIDCLDSQELSYLHLKVCRTWKTKINKEEALQEKITMLEHELVNKQRNTHQHIAELDKKLAEERIRLQEVRERVCSALPARAPPSRKPSVPQLSPVGGGHGYMYRALRGENTRPCNACLAGDATMCVPGTVRCRRGAPEAKTASYRPRPAECPDEVPTRLRRAERDPRERGHSARAPRRPRT